MNIVKTTFLLSSLLFAGISLAQSQEAGWGRHVKKPADVVFSKGMQMLDASFIAVRGHIDEDVLDLAHKYHLFQIII